MVFSSGFLIDVSAVVDQPRSRDASAVFKVFEPARGVGEVTFSFLNAPQVEVQFAHPGAEAFGQDAGIKTAQSLAEGIVRGRAAAEVAKRSLIFPL